MKSNPLLPYKRGFNKHGPNKHDPNKHGLILGCFALVVTLALATTQCVTQERIDSNEKRRVQNTLAEVLPALSYDHPLEDNSLQIFDPIANKNRTCYIANLDGKPVAAVLTAVATDGYSGNIEMLVGITIDGTVSGVRVTKHIETPGLGDAIESQRSDWIKGFNGTSLNTPVESQWTVKKQGGEFDQFTGATITPRAVVNEVKNTLVFFESVKSQLFNHE